MTQFSRSILICILAYVFNIALAGYLPAGLGYIGVSGLLNLPLIVFTLCQIRLPRREKLLLTVFMVIFLSIVTYQSFLFNLIVYFLIFVLVDRFYYRMGNEYSDKFLMLLSVYFLSQTLFYFYGRLIQAINYSLSVFIVQRLAISVIVNVVAIFVVLIIEMKIDDVLIQNRRI